MIADECAAAGCQQQRVVRATIAVPIRRTRLIDNPLELPEPSSFEVVVDLCVQHGRETLYADVPTASAPCLHVVAWEAIS